MGCVASSYNGAEEDVKKEGSGRAPHNDVVMKCKERNRLMKNAVKGRQDFAIAHSSYIQSLQSVGLALRRLSEGSQFINSHDNPKKEEAEEEEGSHVNSQKGLGFREQEGSHFNHIQGAHLVDKDTHLDHDHVHFNNNLDCKGVHHQALSPPSPPAVTHSSSQVQQLTLTYRNSPLSSSSSSSIRNDSTSINSSVLAKVTPLASSLPHDNSSSSSSSSITRKKTGSNNHDDDDDDDDDDDECSFLSSSNTPDRDLAPAMPSSSPYSSWFNYDIIFDPPPIPYHLAEQRRIRSEKCSEEPGDMDMDEKNAHAAKDRSECLLNKEEKEREPYLEDKLEEDSMKKNEKEVSQAGNGKDQEKVVASQRKGVEHVVESLKEEDEENETEKEEEEEEHDDDEARDLRNERGGYGDLAQSNTELALVITSSEAKDLIRAVRYIHDHFTRASMSGKDVSCLLETSKISQDNTGLIGSKDSSKVFNAITSHWSRKTSVAVRDAFYDSDDPECGMLGSHASTLERIYAWERKLYEEVKAGETVRAVFDRKCRKLQQLSAKGTDQIAIDKVRVSVKKLDSQLMVALQSIDLASTTIQRLTNEELYPQLVELLEGLMHMWKVMCECHRAQQAIASQMQTIDTSSINGVEASESHIKAISDLERELGNWRTYFQRWIISQKNYIFALNAWLSKCHIEPEIDKRGRPIGILERPTIFYVLKQWCSSLEHLEQVQSVVEAIGNFSNVVRFLRVEHGDNVDVKRLKGPISSSSLKMRDKKCLEYKEVEVGHETSVVESDADRSSCRRIGDIRIAQVAYDRKEKILSRFREHLPYVFESMALFAKDALRKYESLQQANTSMRQES